MKDDEDEVLVSMEQQDTRELETKGGGELHGIGFTITKVTACTQLAEMHVYFISGLLISPGRIDIL